MERTGSCSDAIAGNAAGGIAYTFGPFRLDVPRRSLHRHEVRVELGARAFDILALLVRRAGQLVRHDELVSGVWAGISVSPGTPRVHLAALRKALGCRPDRIRYIVNVLGRGYCFVAPVTVGDTGLRAEGPATGRAATGPDPRVGAPVPEPAEQLFAKLDAVLRTIAGRLHPHRDPDPVPGRHSGYGASTTCGALAVRAAVVLLTCVAADPELMSAPARAIRRETRAMHYRTATIDGIDLFYREAGPAGAPVVVLLHGFPTSSHMFRNLIPALLDRYRVIAPDYPGFGQSAAPDHTRFSYTFANYARLLDGLLQHLGAARYALYVMDYGAPVGYRLALLHPERISALIVQNGNAYDEGLGAFWDPIRAYWADGSEARRGALDFLLAPETTRFQYVDGVDDVSRISPDNWVHDQALLDRPGNRDIQLDLFRDYGSNVPLYPSFQRFFREYQPPTLIVWGRRDTIFVEAGAAPYLRDLPNAELHLLDTGHFALEDKLEVMAPMIHDFLDRSIATR